MLYKIVVAPRLKLRKLGLPYPPPSPVIGNLNDFGPNSTHIAQIEWQKKYGDIYAVQFFHVPSIWISKPDILRQIMVKDFSNFPNHFSFNQSLPPFDKTVAELRDHDWKRVRNILVPTFTTSKLRVVVPLIKQATSEFIQRLIEADTKGEKLDMWSSCGQLSMKVILGTAFGVEIESKEQEEKLTKAAGVFFRTDDMSKLQTLLQFLVFTMPNVFKHIEPLLGGRFSNAVNYIVDITKNVIRERRDNLAAGKPCRKDMMQHMIEAGGQDKLSDDEIVSQAVIFLLAGYETTQNALSFTIYALATNPEAQQKLIDEIDSHCLDGDSINYDIISSMSYLDMVISETLRLYPPATITNRDVKKSTTIDGIFFPDDIMVGIPIYAIHHDARLWPEPERFKPERFTPEAKANQHPFAYLPFGNGPRNCIGMRLALLEVKLALIKILQNVEFVAIKETEVPLKLRSINTLAPTNPIYLGIRKRF
ncbi:uncharacterized protein TRIADDRAFT_56208 [Trichoplax adhaerens]|uniref:Cytochrome P450 n=1 Tax=Trichoplax adhaerens TaxID=10228 RepID=B3RXH2_TRIAD|nr:hypothetical protein TRIADDRAFT_56208 [Trichoplax adhaerens]EDV24426.1 hypothetical protein TRIADDRAFT_56208 [Trichoplax adhaerens]|eukprot:XP_002112316.1 hypothetical protein TRIADDRAFT_56208 [Trichoplax adhaerens]